MVIEWESLDIRAVAGDLVAPDSVSRVPVPGGWIVGLRIGEDMAPQYIFVPDPDHAWSG